MSHTVVSPGSMPDSSGPLATRTTPSGSSTGATSAALARFSASEAFTKVAAEAVQMHGGIAITWEHDIQLYFKRAHGSAQLLGPPREHLRRLESEVL